MPEISDSRGDPITAYIARRLLLALLSVFAVSILSFFILELPPGNVADRLWAVTVMHGFVGPDQAMLMHAELTEYLALDKPKVYRYGRWVWHLMRGDLGRSLIPVSGLHRQELVKDRIADRLWLTVVLTGFTIIVTWTFAIPVGIYSAVRQHSIGDYVFTTLGFSGLAVPDFLLGLVLMYIGFAYFDQSVGGLQSAEFERAGWIETGRVNWPKIWDFVEHLWIPAIVLGTSGTAGLIRIMRNNLLDELGKPYVVTARAKGLGPVKTVLKYPVRVAINPLVSTVGYLLPSLVSGSIIVSVVLGLPTIGPILLDAILLEDTNTAGVIILMLGTLVVIGTLISDILLAVVDPRIKLTG